uniref:Uncharacterized protein n=1 Tax=Timema poppense TaxID=170557 RepID=A0A7R9DJQ2_TIMPO|nr:unnamed protein product [Timema poppensis]
MIPMELKNDTHNSSGTTSNLLPAGNTKYTTKIARDVCMSLVLWSKRYFVNTGGRDEERPVIIIDVTSTNQPKLMKLKPIQIEEHLKCQCSCKLSPSDCSKIQIFDPDSCLCRCNNKTVCNNGLSWDPMKCGCL